LRERVGYGVHNLWTYLFHPFNLPMYRDDSLFLRDKEREIYTQRDEKGTNRNRREM